jgi:hypothetical protein
MVCLHFPQHRTESSLVLVQNRCRLQNREVAPTRLLVLFYIIIAADDRIGVNGASSNSKQIIHFVLTLEKMAKPMPLPPLLPNEDSISRNGDEPNYNLKPKRGSLKWFFSPDDEFGKTDFAE